MINLFKDNITEVFDFLFYDDKDSVITFKKGKGILKMNPVAREFFSCHKIDELEKKMDKSSLIIWNNFLQDAIISTIAKCQIYLLDSCENVFLFEGCYDRSNFQYVIRFKQAQKKIISSGNVLDFLKYESIFKHAPYGLILTSVEGVIIEVNQKIDIFFEISSREFVGENFKLLFDLLPDSKPDSIQYMKTLLTKGSAELIASKFDESGVEKFYHVISIFNENVNIYMTVICDDTEKIHLRKQIEHLRSLSTLGQLAASIAHEIRNPMTSLKGFTQLLSHQVTKEGSQYLSIIESELNRMDSILNEFLVLSKPTEKSFRFISLSSLISQVVDFMHPQGILKNIEFDYVSCDQGSDCILGDSYELKKVFMNILKNAIEVMPKGGKVTITQNLIENNQVRVSVTDQGEGITADQMHKIFLPFYTSKQQGTGLGLPHAVQTIEDHGGYIDVESEINQGTTFNLVLPLYPMDSLEVNLIPDKQYAKSSN
ncbi:ATP-binding protein [Paenisporosarcina sp. TG-14]|uniref:ATP-binding protein n=1 Tax=Paenisporosarcina sp. TG-14 TaxID=1231057 RepID=UPI00056134E1|nr:ATP-binding protein [Paenisporosarcina sp. TG-14]